MLAAKVVYPKIKKIKSFQKGQSTQENNIIKIIFSYKTDLAFKTANSYPVGKKLARYIVSNDLSITMHE